MTATTPATVASLEVIGCCENQKALFGKVEIFIFQTSGPIWRYFLRHPGGNQLAL